MENRASVVRKVTALVTERYAGDWKAAFDSYAVNGRISSDALQSILKAAGVGYAIGRPLIASQIMTVMDANGDGSITFEEFQQLARV